ncbi:MAG: hypothetical protein PHD54_11250 [Desulfuromonadaceae bacterium]|nr:hypothetical protein [Desulfuromonadaceae bacterium]
MTPDKDIDLRNQAKYAAATLMRHYRYGSYRIIKDPEGVVSLWAIEGDAKEPFSISFADKGRVYNSIEDLPDGLLKSFLEYVRTSAHRLR